MAAYEVYATQLSQLRHGYPLWFPEPCNYDEVTVGDVGYIREGVFHRLFNATKDANDPENALYGVPEGFVRLELPPGSILKNAKFLDPGAALHSHSVSKLAVTASATGSVLPAGAELQFSCSSSEGAVLVLTRPTIRENVIARDGFEDYIRAHFRSWYQLANDRLRHGVKPGKIMLVTGCDKTAEWASAVFSGNARNTQISFTVGSPTTASGQLMVLGLWEHGQSAQHRTGPVCRDQHVKYDQTIFIRGYRVRERPFLAPKVIKAGAEPRPDPPGSGEQDRIMIPVEPDNIEDDEIEIESIMDDGDQQDYDPAGALLEHKLRGTSDQIIIVHDDEWCDGEWCYDDLWGSYPAIPGYFLSIPSAPQSFGNHVQTSAYLGVDNSAAMSIDHNELLRNPFNMTETQPRDSTSSRGSRQWVGVGMPMIPYPSLGYHPELSGGRRPTYRKRSPNGLMPPPPKDKSKHTDSKLVRSRANIPGQTLPVNQAALQGFPSKTPLPSEDQSNNNNPSPTNYQQYSTSHPTAGDSPSPIYDSLSSYQANPSSRPTLPVNPASFKKYPLTLPGGRSRKGPRIPSPEGVSNNEVSSTENQPRSPSSMQGDDGSKSDSQC